jgi:hypothetical protein
LAANYKRLEVLLSDRELVEQLLARSDARLRLELTMSADQLPGEQAVWLLQKLIKYANDNTSRSLIIAAAGLESWRLIESSPTHGVPLDAKTRNSWLASLLPHWCQQLSSKNSIENDALRSNLQQLIHRELQSSNDPQGIWADAIAKLPSQAIADRFLDCWLPEDRTAWLEKLRKTLDQPEADASEQERRAHWLRFATADQRATWLDRVLSPNHPATGQMATIEACLWADAKATTLVLLDRFSGMTPRIQEPVLLAVIANPDAVEHFANAIEEKRIPIAQITPSARQRMASHPNMAIRKRFLKRIDSTVPTDSQVQAWIE